MREPTPEQLDVIDALADVYDSIETHPPDSDGCIEVLCHNRVEATPGSSNGESHHGLSCVYRTRLDPDGRELRQ